MTKAGNRQGRSNAHIASLLSTEISTTSVHSRQAVRARGEGSLRSGLLAAHPAELELIGVLPIDRPCAPCSASVCGRCTFHTHRDGGALTNSLFRHIPAQSSAELGKTSSATQIDLEMSTSHHHVAERNGVTPAHAHISALVHASPTEQSEFRKALKPENYKFKERFT